MIKRFSPHWFALIFCAVYLGCFWLEQPLLYYLPLSGDWLFGQAPSDAPTVMHWYGLTLSALAAGTIAGMALPDAWLPERLRGLLIFLPPLAMALCVFLLRAYFWPN